MVWGGVAYYYFLFIMRKSKIYDFHISLSPEFCLDLALVTNAMEMESFSVFETRFLKEGKLVYLWSRPCIVNLSFSFLLFMNYTYIFRCLVLLFISISLIT